MNPEELSRTYIDEINKERRAQRRAGYIKLSVIGGLAFLYLVMALWAVYRPSGPSGDYVAMVRISGEIGPGKDASMAALGPQLQRAFADKKAKGVVLLINSPGGTPVQSSLIHDRVVALKAKYGKKVVAVGEDMLTSGAYFVAVSADEIVVNRSTLAGSIGVISRSFGFTNLMEKIGVERRVMTAGESKNMMDPFGPQSEQDKVKQSELLQAIHGHFKDIVIKGRGARLKLDSPGLFSGTVWTGETAVSMGLVDKLGDIRSASQQNFGTETVYEYLPSKTLVEIVLEGIGLKVSQALAPRIEGPMALPE